MKSWWCLFVGWVNQFLTVNQKTINCASCIMQVPGARETSTYALIELISSRTVAAKVSAKVSYSMIQLRSPTLSVADGSLTEISSGTAKLVWAETLDYNRRRYGNFAASMPRRCRVTSAFDLPEILNLEPGS